MRFFAILSLFMLSAGVAGADDKKEATSKKVGSPEEQLAAILKDRNEAMAAFSKAYAAAKTPTEKNRVFADLYPKPAKYAPRYLQLAKDHADDPVAVKALSELILLSRSGDTLEEALGILSKNHYKSPQIGAVCQRLIYSPHALTEPFLRKVLEKNPHPQAKGFACFSLAQYRKQLGQMANYLKQQPQVVRSYEGIYGKALVAQLKTLKPEQLSAETEALFERVVKEFGDVRGVRRTLGEAAKGELFEIRNLAIGKVAPDIAGEDVDGVPFKLSDYRGKVVVIDFWGDW